MCTRPEVHVYKLGIMQRKMSVELRVTSKGEGILTLVGTKVINWVRGKKYKIKQRC